jgi:hypothetical protein
VPRPARPAPTLQGKVTQVEDFGVVVEWADAAGAKRSGLLHVSEMRAPAAAAAAELGESPPAAAAAEGDEGEFTGDQFVDVGGVDKPSRYYKVGRACRLLLLGGVGGLSGPACGSLPQCQLRRQGQRPVPRSGVHDARR